MRSKTLSPKPIARSGVSGGGVGGPCACTAATAGAESIVSNLAAVVNSTFPFESFGSRWSADGSDLTSPSPRALSTNSRFEPSAQTDAAGRPNVLNLYGLLSNMPMWPGRGLPLRKPAVRGGGDRR
ncbi:Hypothetical protein CINCED_3A024528 [Cinara cedri]|nr:Hypothetical protein CINCED_3A024528 [Cinara cedri]